MLALAFAFVGSECLAMQQVIQKCLEKEQKQNKLKMANKNTDKNTEKEEELLKAVRGENYEEVKRIVCEGETNVNVRERHPGVSYSWTALHIAAFLKDSLTIRALLDHTNIDIKMRVENPGHDDCYYNKTALFIAVDRGAEKAVRVLLSEVYPHYDLMSILIAKEHAEKKLKEFNRRLYEDKSKKLRGICSLIQKFICNNHPMYHKKMLESL